ncbi:hypothetical protein WH50_10505 [Pokkaliibacter plantistimulans]|uniref:5' nucleotidase, deoxy (Pyrimidine), cytosolic type C protein (NT5C) n=2 Tax=Pokkaliibacter plantistimulans TaxID=1635171 RepID=A0ABX5M1H9_9GAMM|nr:hypothetical protein WH50_10505 [Pokkaliibacter plantistimulans]
MYQNFGIMRPASALVSEAYTMSSKVVVLDIDDVLTITREKVYEAMRAASGKDIHWQHWSEYDLRLRFEMTHEDIMDVFNSHDIINQVDPEPDAAPFINLCRDAGYRVVALTARGWHPDADLHTWAYFERYQLKVDELHICTPVECKSDYIRQLGNVHLYVDDHLRHIMNVREKTDNVRHLVLMDRPWNQTEEPIERVFQLSECQRFL